MKSLYLILAVLLFTDVPYKPSGDFSFKLDFQFKSRPMDNKKIYEAEAQMVNSSPLPFLKLNVEMIKLAPEEVKVKLSTNKDKLVFARKVTEGTVVEIPFGFTDDVKDEITPNTYTLTLLDKDKNELSRIVFYIDKEGTFFVNGEKQGKF